LFVRAMELTDLAKGGIRGVTVEGVEVVLCNVDNGIFAVSRRCGHENAPLNFGTLNRNIITCPLHFAQFDVRTGKALLGPASKDYGKRMEPPLSKEEVVPKFKTMLHQEMGTHDLRTFKVKVEDGAIWVDVSCSLSEFIMGPY
jgi:nitrite reductase/ring-hydroxylating ferredoxin subunit